MEGSTHMQPLQTTIDGVVDGAVVFGEQLIGRYWWAGVVVLLAFYLRMYGAAYIDPDVEAPTARAFPLLAKKMYGYAREAGSIAVFFGFLAGTSLIWAFDITSVVLTGLPGADPFIWGVVAAAGSAAVSGVHDLVIEGIIFAGVDNYSGFWTLDFLGEIGLVEVVIAGAGAYIVVALAEQVFGLRSMPDEEDTGFDPDERGYGFLPGIGSSNRTKSPVERLFGDDDD